MGKNRKKPDDFLDNETIKKLKFIIIVCCILCIIFEFLPDIVDIYQLSRNSAIITFLYAHQGFFTNVFLGCLGSAIISYIMLCISVKVKKDLKKENLYECVINVIRQYSKLDSSMICFIDNVEFSELFEPHIINATPKLISCIESLMGMIIDIDINVPQINELIDLCETRLIPLSKEIDFFNNISQQNNGWSDLLEKEFNDNRKNMCIHFYKSLRGKYSSEDLRQKLNKIAFELKLSQEILDRDLEDIKTFEKQNSYILYNSYYMTETSDFLKEQKKKWQQIANEMQNNPSDEPEKKE